MHQAQHLGDVQLHRVLGDAQLVGYLVVGQALAHQPRHRLLAGRQLAEQRIARGHLAFRDRRRRRGRLAVFAPEGARLAVAVYLVLDLVDVAVDRVQRFGEVFQALVDVAQAQLAADALVQAALQAFEAMQQFLRRHRFLVVVGGADPHGLDHFLAAIVTGEDDRFEEPAVAGDFLEALDQADTVVLAQVEVADDQADVRVGLEAGDRRLPVGAGYATVATVFQQFAEFRGHLGFIIDDQDAEMPRGRFVHGHTLHLLILFFNRGRALECSHTEWY